MKPIIHINCITVKCICMGCRQKFESHYIWEWLQFKRCHHSWGSGYLAGIHGDRCEGGLCQGNCGSQEVPCICPFLLVLSAVFHFQLFFWQNSFITRSIPGRRKELKFSMSPPKQKAYPEKDACRSRLYLWHTENFPNQQNRGINYEYKISFVRSHIFF